jgi:hypothetical protein
MRLLSWRDKPWQKRALLVLTAVLLVLLAAHPELRLLVPVVDLLGIDLFVLLAASPLLEALRPALNVVRDALPRADQLYFYGIFCLGIAGPYIDGLLRAGARGRSR